MKLFNIFKKRENKQEVDGIVRPLSKDEIIYLNNKKTSKPNFDLDYLKYEVKKSFIDRCL